MQIGRSTSLIQEDISLGLSKIVSKHDFRVLEKVKRHGGGMLVIVMKCLRKTFHCMALG